MDFHFATKMESILPSLTFKTVSAKEIQQKWTQERLFAYYRLENTILSVFNATKILPYNWMHKKVFLQNLTLFEWQGVEQMS